MTKGYMVEARLKNINDDGHMVTGYYAVAKDTEAEAEAALVVFVSRQNGGTDSGITAHVRRPLDDQEAAKLDPGQIRQKA